MTPIKLSVDLNKVATCRRCKVGGIMDNHHVTYRPAKVVKLCRSCHLGITVINIKYGMWHGRLTNSTRRMLYRKFIGHPWRMSDEKRIYKSFVYVRYHPECLKKLLSTFKMGV